MATATLTVELFTEELPPKALKTLGAAFAERVAQGLVQAQLAPADAVVTTYATPRRLGVSIAGVVDRAPDRVESKKLMPAKVAYDASGAPTAALAKRLEKEGALARRRSTRDGGDQVWTSTSRARASTLAAGLQRALDDAIAKLPIPKLMSYQRRSTTAATRARVDGRVRAARARPRRAARPRRRRRDGARPRRRPHHRRPSLPRQRHVDDPDPPTRYASTLLDDGKVVAGFAERRTTIMTELAAVAGADRVVMPDALLDEVTALVEWPAVYRGTFDAAFLDVPQECLILTMQQNQKYFALTDDAGRLVDRFLVVSNIATDEPGGDRRRQRARAARAARRREVLLRPGSQGAARGPRRAA